MVLRRDRPLRPLPPVWVMALALVAVAANLRIAITSVPPLLDAISADLGLSHAAAGALTTLPVLCMGLFAPVASRIAHRTGATAAVLAALVGMLAWAPFAVRANPHHTPGEAGPGRLPWGHPTAWLVAGYLALQSWCFYSAVTWLAPTYVEHGWSCESAGFLAAAFSGAQIVSGLLGPVLSDRTHDMRRLLLPAAMLGVAGSVGIWLAPLTAPWLWAVVTGLGQGAAFSLALVLLVRYTRTPEASGRLTGMAFLISYGIASIGPVAMGLVRDVTGGLSLVWAVLAAIGVVQAVVVVRLRPDNRRVG